MTIPLVGSARLCRMDVGTQQILIIVTRSRAIGTNGKEAHDLKATITFRVR